LGRIAEQVGYESEAAFNRASSAALVFLQVLGAENCRQSRGIEGNGLSANVSMEC